MRGSPLLRAALMLAALLALLVPLRHFTAARPAAAAIAAPAASSGPVHLRIVSTAAPFTFSVSHLGREIWRGDAAGTSAETRVELPWPPAGVDLALDARWASGRTAAVKLSAARGDDEPAAQTAWGDGAVSEVFTFR